MIRLTIIALLGFGFFSCDDAAPSEVPAAVKSAFETAYPGATDVEWEMDDEGYEVEFNMNGEEMEVEYDAMGNVLSVDADD